MSVWTIFDRATPATEVLQSKTEVYSMPRFSRHISSQPTKTKGKNPMNKELAKTYDPKGIEDRLYQK